MVDYKVTPPDEYPSPEIVEMQTLGSEGKLWTLTTIYNIDAETKQHVERNLKVGEVKKKRSEYFREGFAVRLGEGSYLIVPPFDILRMYLDRQDKYFGG